MLTLKIKALLEQHKVDRKIAAQLKKELSAYELAVREEDSLGIELADNAISYWLSKIEIGGEVNA